MENMGYDLDEEFDRSFVFVSGEKLILDKVFFNFDELYVKFDLIKKKKCYNKGVLLYSNFESSQFIVQVFGRLMDLFMKFGKVKKMFCKVGSFLQEN